MMPPDAFLSAEDYRNLIRAEIDLITPLDELEQQHLAETRAWISSGAELCRLAKPATPPRHLVSYFVCIDGDSVLLVDHKKALLWLPSGGHVEPGEHPRLTVQRECREELGIDAHFVLPHPLLLTCTETVGLTAGHTDVSLWYVLSADSRKALNFDAEEFNGINWFTQKTLPYERADPHMHRFMEKRLALLHVEGEEE